MTKTRDLLFYEFGHGRGISPLHCSKLRSNDTLSYSFYRMFAAARTAAGDPITADELESSGKHDFYTWDLENLDPSVLVSCVPNPGIVIAIWRTLGETSGVASALKLLIEQTSDPVQCQLRDSFLKSGKGSVDDAALARDLADAIEVKPGVFGLAVDVKKAFRALFRRRQK